MDNPQYNSLAKQLIQSGLLSDDTFQAAKKESEIENNFFESLIQKEDTKNKKRINQYDLELITQNNEKNKKNIKNENIFFKIFPKIYQAKLAKDALNKLKSLKIDPKSLSNKSIPYGEGELRYSNLIKYLHMANELQTKINNKT